MVIEEDEGEAVEVEGLQEVAGAEREEEGAAESLVSKEEQEL